MITNKKKCGAIKRAVKFGVPHCYVSHNEEDQMVGGWIYVYQQVRGIAT